VFHENEKARIKTCSIEEAFSRQGKPVPLRVSFSQKKKKNIKRSQKEKQHVVFAREARKL
jgi:hypothetical protein